jgi:hypothetical protein
MRGGQVGTSTEETKSDDAVENKSESTGIKSDDTGSVENKSESTGIKSDDTGSVENKSESTGIKSDDTAVVNSNTASNENIDNPPVDVIPEKVPEIKIYPFDGVPTEVFVDQQSTYKEWLSKVEYNSLINTETDRILAVKNSNLESVDNSITYDSQIMPGQDTIHIFVYRYPNNATDNHLNESQHIQITQDDISMVDDKGFIGNRVSDTDRYIDHQGILRIYDNNHSIYKITVTESPFDDEELSDNVSDENSFLKEATDTLKSISNLLHKIKVMLPDYMEAELDGKKYIFSKETPFLIIDKSQESQQELINNTTEPTTREPEPLPEI